MVIRNLVVYVVDIDDVGLALFDPRNYAPIMGKLALPSLIAQAAAPTIGTFLILHLGADGTLAALTLLGGLKVGAVLALYACVRLGGK